MSRKYTTSDVDRKSRSLGRRLVCPCLGAPIALCELRPCLTQLGVFQACRRRVVPSPAAPRSEESCLLAFRRHWCRQSPRSSGSLLAVFSYTALTDYLSSEAPGADVPALCRRWQFRLCCDRRCSQGSGPRHPPPVLKSD